MEVSRIFVNGLPPSYTEREFRQHFAKRYNITDIKLLASRRIGYVGFKTPQDAAAAVKYFNKSFIRMSRISVEFADNNRLKQPTAHPTSLSTALNTPTTTPHTDGNAMKRKRHEQPTRQDDPKLKEYLGLMQPPSKRKPFEEDEIFPALAVQQVAQSTATQQDTMEDDEITVPAAKRVDINTSDKAKTDVVVKHGGKKRKETIADVEQQPQVLTTTDRADEEVVHESAALNTASDIDWMRSRTSRLLGLQDEEAEEDVAGRVEKGNDGTSESSGEEESQHNSEADARPSQDASDLPTADLGSPRDNVEKNEVSEALQSSGRLFLRNLAYTITENDLRLAFSTFGSLQEVHVPLDSHTGVPKGFAFVQYDDHENAIAAFEKMDSSVFQGRLLHVIPAADKRENKLDEFALSKLPLKKQKQIQRKAESSSSTFNWNSMYMNVDAVLSSVADRLGVSKSEVFDPTSSDAAVKQAQAETHVVQETKAYFGANGVDLDAFSNKERGDTAILVKNFSYGTTTEELKTLFEEYGELTRVLMPPSGTIAIIEFKLSTQTRAAFHSLAYRKFKNSVLFLEKAPKNLFKAGPLLPTPAVISSALVAKPTTSDLLQKDEPEVVDTSTLYVRNLNFSTTNERFSETFKPLDGFVSARVSTKPDPKRSGQTLSMGFGFLEFHTAEQARAAQAAMDGYNLDGHQLVIKASRKAYDAAEERKKLDDARKKKERKAKIIIKNLPFEASRKDITNLFKAYGQLKAVRVPKKFDSSRRGFAFAEFSTPREAESAMEALRDTHLLGRRLILEYAAGDSADPEKEIAALQEKVAKQTNNIALQRLTTTERKKFDLSVEDAQG